jgi:phosphatidylserine/phosphatidylglycerophosphate/cardiolipin synthase-like enzyme
MSVKVLDPENRRLYYNDELVFIRSIQTRMNVKSKDVNIVTPNNGNRSSEVVEKFSSEKFSIGKERDVAAELGETTTQNAYRILEDALEFILIDGDKSKKNENIHKAKEVVKKIISRATTRCIICDPYFNLNDLTEFVFTMPQLDVDVRVMSSKAYIGKNAEEAKYNSLQINNEITNFNNRVGTKIGFRLLTGSSPLHDRFIIVDDDVWMLGSSFNEFGNRTTTISKVPKESCRQIYGMAESWWTSDEYTISLEGYGRS